MDWGDVGLIALLLWALWTFIPRHIRRSLRSGVSPAVVVLSEAVLDVVSMVGKVLTHLAYKYLIGNVPMSSSVRDADDELGNETALSQAETNSEIAETSRRVAETGSESFTLAETEALARLVASGKLGLTDAVKIGAGAVSGEKYQKRSREIKAAVARLQQRYPQRTPEQEELRKQLQIGR